MLRKMSIPLVIATLVLGAQAAEPTPAAPEAAPAAKPAHKPVKPIPLATAGVPTPQSGLPAFDPDKRMVTLAERLKLTPEQQAKIKPILVDTQTQVKAARAPGTKPEVARDKVKAILETADVQIRVVLDGTQKDEWETMKKEVVTANRSMFKASTIQK